MTNVSNALDYVHKKGVIHRDLKPANIMISEEEGTDSRVTPKIVDFGLAELRELQKIEDKQVIGTFCYMPPEQCGMLNRPVDERSDLYSMGMIFYELIAGELPFKGKDIGSILHQQIAKSPEPISLLRQDVPSQVEKIAMKLICKEPSERYQSAKGLLADLEKFQKGEHSFDLGKEDMSARLSFRTGLIGRDEELDNLKSCYAAAQSKAGGICFISGEAGKGKTRLVEEFRNYVVSSDGTFLSGKCFAQENKIPYQPFREILDEFVEAFHKQSVDRRRVIAGKVCEAVGELGAILIKLNPMMTDILGEVHPLVSLEPDRENRRFLMVCSRMFCRLAQENPLVFLLDDLQWADEGSMALLEQVLQDIDKSSLFIVGTYRDNEVGPEHSVSRITREAKERGRGIAEIHLDSFDATRMFSFIGEMFSDNVNNLKDLASYILQKSHGNPFFTIEIIRQLVDENIIYRKDKRWLVDWQNLQGFEISPTILDIVLRRIELLTDEETLLLSYGAVIGRKFELKLLFRLYRDRDEEVVAIVDRAIELQLIEESFAEKGRILFVHDRIRDAFYQKIPPADRRDLHHEIACVIERTETLQTQEVVFELSHHFMESGDDAKALEYAVPSAKLAKESYANEEAIKYSLVAKVLFEKKGQKGSSKWKKIVGGLAEVYLTIGRNDDAIALIEAEMPAINNKIEKALMYRQISTAFFKKGDRLHCEIAGQRGLNLLGERLVLSKAGAMAGLAKELIIHVFHSLFPSLYQNRRKVDRVEKTVQIIWLHLTLGWMYILSDTLKFMRSALRILNVAEARIGRSKELGLGIGGYASVCMAIPLFKRAVRYHEAALQMRQELGDEWGIAQSLQWMGYCNKFSARGTPSLEYFLDCLNRFEKIGDAWEMGMSLIGVSENYTHKSNYTMSIKYTRQHGELSEKIGDHFGMAYNKTMLSQYYNETGNYREAETCGKHAVELSKKFDLPYISCVANIRLGAVYLNLDEPETALRYLRDAEILDKEHSFLQAVTSELYPLLADAYIRKLDSDGQKQRQVRRRELVQARRTVKRANKKTKRWPVH